ncbi:DUF262 domain-containing protein [Flavobacterium soyangense]|uniref:DUF262 domain-containing protein n=1 Tax=Flavobacterium soyangense TaxID=2023265 RepID=A0A930XTC0_9FLAO|nr:DUF262 domain-containing protein [Flavobacterium soyangense]MBF2707310.1 DUF262 domain-containing protein [Flavobacterium soyangense]
MNKVNINGNDYEILDVLEKISIADSFVLPSNKIGSGSGEAKLYVGQVGDKLKSFFGERGFEINCFLSKTNLLRYLNSVYSEYLEPNQAYRLKEKLPLKWEERKAEVISKEVFIHFIAKDQNQIDGPRLYINSTNSNLVENNYLLLRKLPLPIITHLNIYKLKNTITENINYFFCLFLNGVEVNIYEELDENLIIDSEYERLIPVSEDIIEIEEELGNEFEETTKEIKIPFDPNKIKVRTDSSSIGQIIEDLEAGVINMNTEFQRLAGLWDIGKKSRLIESLILKLPIPAFYFNEMEENDLEVVDGLQRISTIKEFIVLKNKFKLVNLEFLHELEGLTFNELPSIYQRRIKTFQITTYVIEKGTPDEVKYNIFKRVNTGGLSLTPQEIRHAINQGRPSKLIAELVYKNSIEGKSFHRATDGKMSESKRMEDRDFANRFVAFYLNSYENYKPDLDTFLNTGMSKIKEKSESEIIKLKEDYIKGLNLSFDIFKNDAFRKRFNKNDSRKPINKALFEVLTVSFAKLNNNQILELKNKKDVFKRKFIELHKNINFLRSISTGTAQKENVFRRFTEIERIIKETLER